MAASLMKRADRISTESVVSALRWSLALDLLWLHSARVPQTPDPIPQWLLICFFVGVIFSTSYFATSPSVWQERVKRLRVLLSTRYGAIALFVFATGLTVEVLSYLAAITGMDLEQRVSVGVGVGLVVMQFQKRLLAQYINDDQPAQIAPLVLGSLVLRVLAAATIIIEPGPLRWAVWVACVLNMPRSPQNVISR